MGVKDFWNVSSPCEERISLHSLRGQTLAIDLAGWIVQNQTVPGMQHRVTRPHLRNIVFRTNSLLSLDILPVFVLDGAAPKLKSQTVEQRNQLNWGTRATQAKPTQITSSPKVQKRRQFNGVLKECASLCESLGLPYIVAPGEAEAYCAALDRSGLVDGIISDDSDSMCYGARTVYKNFTTDPKSFSVSKYSNKRLRKELGISRERVVIMSVMLGCDYAAGVTGVGKDNLVKLFQLWGDPVRGELQKVVNWSLSDMMPELPKTPHCGTCGHPGTVGAHRKTGCRVCGTDSCCTVSNNKCECDYHSKENQLAIVENNIRRKALESPGWPYQDVIDEFYLLDHQTLHHTFSWSCPSPSSFLKICMTRMDWEQEYTLEKIQHLMARWQVKNSSSNSGVEPVLIVKSRIQGGQNMLEVEFRSSLDSLPESFTACVPTADFETGYSDILTQWIEQKEAKKKKPKKKKENKDPEKVVKKCTKTKSELVKQPSIKQFFGNKNDTELGALENQIAKVNLQPKKVVLKTKSYNDKKVVVSAKNVTVEKDSEPISEVINVEDEDSLADSFFNLSIGGVGKNTGARKEFASTPNMTDDSEIRESLDDSYNSDMSAILNEILGISDDRGNSKGARLSVNEAKVEHKTSTPDVQNLIYNTKSQDYGSPVLAVKPSTSADKKFTNNENRIVEKQDVASDDEFDNMLNHCTPLLDRVKKRLGNH